MISGRLVLLAGLILGATACSHSEPSGGAAPKPSATSAPKAKPAENASPTPRVTAAEKPFADYVPIGDDALAWVGQYYAVAGDSVDYAAVAQRLEPTYRNATDTFAKRDALAAFSAKLDKAIADARANPYIRIPPYQAQLPAYDLDHTHYDLSGLISPDSILDVGNSAAQVRMAPAPDLATYAPANEAEARATEKTLSSEPFPRKVVVTVYGKVVSADVRGGQPSITIAPARVEMTTFALNGPTAPVLTVSVH